MSTQVIVVKRSRRRFFAAPRALPDWLNAVWAARSSRSEADATLQSSGAGTISSADRVGPLTPELSIDATGAHLCTGCDLCVRVCPSRCLHLTAEGEGASRRVLIFGLEQTSCIGCGVCFEVCPENALEMSKGTSVEQVVGGGQSSVVDLLMLDA